MTRRETSLFLFLWAAAAMLAYQVDRLVEPVTTRLTMQDTLGRLLGSATEIVGDAMYLKADSYLHGGVDFGPEAHEEGAEGAEGERDRLAEKAPADWVQRVLSRVRAHDHRHLEGEDRKELLPFFAMATTLDPHNIDAVLAAAYWLDNEMGRTDEALDTLEKGARANPGSWEIQKEIARFLWTRRKDAAATRDHALSAIRLSENAEIPAYQRLDLYYYLGESSAVLGRKAQALEAYRRALAADSASHPNALRSAIEARIRELSPGASERSGDLL